MNVSILTLFPDLYTPFIKTSLIGKAIERGQISINTQDFFSFCAPKERLDSPTYGPGAGMVLKPLIVEQAIKAQEHRYGPAYKIFFSPHGRTLNQQRLRQLAQIMQEKKHVMLICARYEGMDARVEEVYADDIISIGDYVLMGGDLPAMVLLEGVLRYIPGVVGKDESVRCDSFTGPLVDYPEYTEPVDWHGHKVPDILRSGNHAAIGRWRQEQALNRTLLCHFDWLRSWDITDELRAQVQAALPAHYIALMHDEVVLKEGRVGTSSITSLDIHDIARSVVTYGLKKYFLVTSLEDQTKIAHTLIDFWLGEGKEYNPHRHEAIKRVQMAANLEFTVATIEKETDKKPLLVATSAREHVLCEHAQHEHAQHEHAQVKTISYHDQGLLWQQERPILFIFGTAGGLSEKLIARCDYILLPLRGLSDFNHLSVRSAVAVVFDRWFGLNPNVGHD